MPVLKVNSVKVYYEVAGTGHPTLLLPPLVRVDKLLKSFPKALAEKYTAITVDLIEHSFSYGPKDMKLYSYERLARYCCQLVGHMKIRRHDIVGMSWTGRTALAYTLLH